MVAPRGKLAGALLVTDDTMQLSVVVGEPSATPVAEHELASVLTENPAGAFMVGFSASLTVTLNEQVGPSELVHVTKVAPTEKCDPEGWSQLIVAGPDAVGVAYVTIAPQSPLSFETVISEGQVNVLHEGTGASLATLNFKSFSIAAAARIVRDDPPLAQNRRCSGAAPCQNIRIGSR